MYFLIREKAQEAQHDLSKFFLAENAKDESTLSYFVQASLFNQQRVVYHYKCGLCNANYVGYMCRHLCQRFEEHKGSSSIGNHIKEQHGTVPSDIFRDFKILRKCQSKFDCLIYKMLFIKELKPTLNKQSDSICAKLFI